MMPPLLKLLAREQLEAKWGVSAAARWRWLPCLLLVQLQRRPVERPNSMSSSRIPTKKIEVIKVIRQLTSLGLKEAKDVAETAGSKVLEAVSKEAATDAKGKLETAGAVVEVQ
jgi:large subunit ribosomal protein L7/L12